MYLPCVHFLDRRDVACGRQLPRDARPDAGGKEMEAANWVDQGAAYSEIEACRDRARGAGHLGG
jgi:hypothetical protein